jgi:uncharacterized protein
MTASALYEGWVAHRRIEPVPHSFRYRVFLPLFDLDELPGLLDRFPLWSARRPAPAWFRRDDYLGDSIPLIEAAREQAYARVRRRPGGPVRLLANPRYLGAGFNPVSFYFLYERDREEVDAVIAEVTNTPWGERTAYVLDGRRRGRGGAVTGTFDKDMHVSPFQPLDQRYEIAVSEPADDLRVTIRNLQEGREVFVATMALRRREMTRARMTRMLLSYPPMTIATLVRIYANAARLRLKGAPFHPHPDTVAR